MFTKASRYTITLCLILTASVCFGNVEIPPMRYKLVEDFFKLPAGKNFGETPGVVVAPNGNIFVFTRGPDPIMEFDPNGNYLRGFGADIAPGAHGMRFDRHGNLWVTDVNTHVVLRLNHAGLATMVLGRQKRGSDKDLEFNKPTDIAFGPNDEIFVADGYGNSRIVKYDKDGNYIKTWGTAGNGPGQFKTPHTIVVDGKRGRLYVGDRDNFRTQIFDLDGKLLEIWTEPGAPWGFELLEDGSLLMADGYAERVVHVSPEGKPLGAFGTMGKIPGRFHFAHSIAIDKNGAIYVAEIQNWRVQKFIPVR